MSTNPESSLVARLVHTFVGRRLAPLFALMAIIAGAFALLVTPREEEPQIVVPMADVIIEAPGLDAREVERQVSTRMEKLLRQVDGVEYVYSVSQPNRAIVTVRFFVGEDLEDSLIRLRNQVQSRHDQVPPGVASWVIKPLGIDDVPIFTVALHASSDDAGVTAADLRRLAEELELRLQGVEDAGRTEIHGGRGRRLLVRLDPVRMAAHGVTPVALEQALRGANVRAPAGATERGGLVMPVDVGDRLRSKRDVEELVVAVSNGQPLHLSEVADVKLGYREHETYSHIAYGAGADRAASETLLPAVTVSVAKRPGANAVEVARALEAQVDAFGGEVLPSAVEARVTRDYGETANDKVTDLVASLLVAVIIVIALVTATLGWREALVVGVAVPITFSLTLLVNLLAGYTVNRVTLFALILALGLVVDDPIANVDNIQRHVRRAGASLASVIRGLQEVFPPVLMSTLAIIISFVPMFFITGMMGPYMGPMAINVPLAVTFSTVTALTVVPWLSYRLLRHSGADEAREEKAGTHRMIGVFRRLMGPFLRSRRARWLLLGVTGLSFVGAMALPLVQAVPLKLLPYDNKNELQVLIDMDEGTSLEDTQKVAREVARYLQAQAEVKDVSTFVGTASPMDFNGLVRHYYLRQFPHAADLRINLLHKSEREQQSHAFGLRLRPELERIAHKHGALIQVVELPPGPPVLATLTAEVTGGAGQSYDELVAASRKLAGFMAEEQGVVDVDASYQAESKQLTFVVDQEKAALHGVSKAQIAQVLGMSLHGHDVTALHQPHEAQAQLVSLRLPRTDRASVTALEELPLPTADGRLLALGELGSFREDPVDQAVYHKSLEPVVFVYGEVAGRPPADAIFALQSRLADEPLGEGIEVSFSGEGEWKITLDVFRDLGIAFGVALLGIYVLLVYETRSYVLPPVLMIAIPLTAIGIMPGFAILNMVSNTPVGGFDDPVFFTATAMIGMIGLSGIVIRNSVVLITFIHDSMESGMALEEAIVQAGALRLRPILLTAATTGLSSLPITLDPVFSGLAWALIFGIIVSTVFTILVVPVSFYMLRKGKERREPAVEAIGPLGDPALDL